MFRYSSSSFQCAISIFYFYQRKRDFTCVFSYRAFWQPFQCNHVKSGIAIGKFNIGNVIVCTIGNLAVVIILTRNYLLKLSFVFWVFMEPPVHSLLIKRNICNCFCGRWILAKVYRTLRTVICVKGYRKHIVDSRNLEKASSAVIDIHRVPTKLQVQSVIFFDSFQQGGQLSRQKGV